MDLTVSIAPDIATKLRERAAATGKAPEAYAAEVLARDVTRPSIDEILAPVREDFAKTGISEEELMNLGRRAADAARTERCPKTA